MPTAERRRQGSAVKSHHAAGVDGPNPTAVGSEVTGPGGSGPKGGRGTRCRAPPLRLLTMHWPFSTFGFPSEPRAYWAFLGTGRPFSLRPARRDEAVYPRGVDPAHVEAGPSDAPELYVGEDAALEGPQHPELQPAGRGSLPYDDLVQGAHVRLVGLAGARTGGEALEDRAGAEHGQEGLPPLEERPQAPPRSDETFLHELEGGGGPDPVETRTARVEPAIMEAGVGSDAERPHGPRRAGGPQASREG